MLAETNILPIVLRGNLDFIRNSDSTFRGPIKKGLRPIAWILDKNRHSTSCSIISDVIIYEGESKIINIVLLNQLQLDQSIKEGTVLNLGSTSQVFGKFTVKQILGKWEGGKIP